MKNHRLSYFITLTAAFLAAYDDAAMNESNKENATVQGPKDLVHRFEFPIVRHALRAIEQNEKVKPGCT